MIRENIMVPDKQALSDVQKLCDYAEPYEVSEWLDELFVKAMRQNILWHQAHCLFYKKILKKQNFTVSQLNTVENCQTIPFIPANFFKMHEILSISKKDISLHLTSSGTSGQKSQMFFDAWSIDSARRMVDFIYLKNGWITPEVQNNYLLYAYEPEPGMKTGTTNTNIFLTSYAPAKGLFYALRRTRSGKHEFDIFGCIERLQQYEQEGLPVRILGFPAFLYFTLKRMRTLKISPLKLAQGSLVMFGGGWKGYADQSIPKEELYGWISDQLGIEDISIRQSYGSVEHSVPYIECSKHNLHCPIWSRIFVRDVKTLEPVAFGKTGFLNFITPYILSVPAQSVLMGDLGALYPGKDCGCEINTPYFKFLGRAGTSGNKSCAVAASELLKNK
ncbi:long-chain-fatty-acid---luciferin-component ligase [Candidatus Magnetomoraceae bacterium gMMP-15]